MSKKKSEDYPFTPFPLNINDYFIFLSQKEGGKRPLLLPY